MLSFSIYRFVSKPRLCHPDVAGPEGEDFYNFECLADPLHRLYPETARARERMVLVRCASASCEEICILLNDAWELLSDPEKRKDYDAQIELQP